MMKNNNTRSIDEIVEEYLNEDFDETAEESRNVLDNVDFAEYWAEKKQKSNS